MNPEPERKTMVLLAGVWPELGEYFISILKQDGFEVIEAPADDCTLAAQIMRYHPDSVVYDFLVEHRDRFPALEAVHNIFNGTVRCIAYTDCADYETARAFLQSGGLGYVLKGCPEEEILEAIRSAARGIPFLCPHLAGERAKKELDNPPSKKLTPAQKEVLVSIQAGDTAKEIASNRNSSVRTVETHIRNIKKMLRVKRISELRKIGRKRN